MASWCDVEFAGHDFVLDAGLALYWPQQDALVVSDLHLEKSTFLAQFGSALAPYDTHDTLERLTLLLARYRPKSLILLGDTFHDREAWNRLQIDTRQRLLELCGSVETCSFVEGNHDLGLTGHGLRFVDDCTIDGIVFRHEPADVEMPQVIGHYHPKRHIRLHGQKLTGKCFALNQRLLIMPAFGSFTGGLDLKNAAFAHLSGGEPLRSFLVIGNTVSECPEQTYSR